MKKLIIYRILVKLGSWFVITCLCAPIFIICVGVGFYSVATLGELLIFMGKIIGHPTKQIKK